MKVGSLKLGRIRLLSFWITVFLCFVAGHLSASAQTIDDFADWTSFKHLSLSPSGNHYTMVRFHQNGQSEAVVYDRLTQQRVGGLTIPRDMRFTWVEWASDMTLLASVSTSLKLEGRKIHLPTARVFSYDIQERRQPVILFENEDRLLRTNIALNRVVDIIPDNTERILMGAWRNGDFDLYNVNIETGDAERVAKGRDLTLAWFTDVDGAPSLRMDCSTRTCRKIKLYRPEDGADSNDENTDWKFLRSFEQNNPDSDTFLNIQPIGPTGTPNEFYVLDGRDEMPRRSIRIFNVRTNSFVKTLYEDDVYDVKGAIIDPRTRAYLGAQLWRDRIHYNLVDDDLQSHMDTLNTIFEDPWNVSFRDIAEDRSVALVYASASNEPGAYYLYDFKSRDFRLIERTSYNLHNSIRTNTSILKTPVRDGTELTTYVTIPKQDANRRLIILVHGGPEARDVLDYDRDVQFLASRGYTVARINFRGSSGYGRAFAQAGYHQWGGVMHTDIVDATNWLQSHVDIAPEHTCIMGHSYGGYAALLAGALQPQLYNCVVAGSGPSDLNQILKDERRAHGKNSPQLAYWEKSIGDRKADKSMLASISPIHLTDRYDDPILLFHGRYDRVVLPSHSEEMLEALEKAGKSVKRIEMNGGHGHSTWSRTSQIKYMKTLEAFLQTSLEAAESSNNPSDSP